MVKKDLNQVAIAARLEVGTGTISKVLAKPEAMNLKWLAAFAHVLEIEVGDLFRDPDQPTQEDLLRDVPARERESFVRDIRALKQSRFG